VIQGQKEQIQKKTKSYREWATKESHSKEMGKQAGEKCRHGAKKNRIRMGERKMSEEEDSLREHCG